MKSRMRKSRTYGFVRAAWSNPCFYSIKREIKLNWDFSDTYIFRFANVGVSDYDGRNLNFIRAATIPNTNKIITMFPTYNRKSSCLCSLQKEDMLSICNSIVHTDRVYRVKTYSINKK